MFSVAFAFAAYNSRCRFSERFYYIIVLKYVYSTEHSGLCACRDSISIFGMMFGWMANGQRGRNG